MNYLIKQITKHYIKQKKSSSKVYRYTIGLLIIILFFLIFAIPATIYKNDNPGSETLFKEPPTIKRIEPENLGSTITFEIYAKANYDYVTIKLEFYKNDEFQKSRYLTETNLKKGNTYYTKYDFSLEEIIDYGTSENFYIQYKIDSFK